ncbi:MAG: hypothetical protein U0169_11365 [Polyangiaceae bacterium]
MSTVGKIYQRIVRRIVRALSLPRFALPLAFTALLTVSAPAFAQHGESAHGAAAPAEGHGESAHGEGAHGEGHDAHGPAPINWLDFSDKHQVPFAALVINVVLLLGMYWYLGKGPVAAALKKRREDIAKDIEEAKRIKAEAEARAKLYQSKLDKLEQELAEARQALVEAGKGERERIIREAEEKAVRIQKDAEFMIEQELKQMRLDLLRETVESAVSAAEDLLKKRVTQSDQERLAEDFLGELSGRGRTSLAPSTSIAPKENPS